MNLSDLKPRSTSFTLRVQGKAYKLVFRPLVLKDLAWLDDTYGQGQAAVKIVGQDLTAIANILWYQLNAASKKAVKSIKATFQDFDPHSGDIIELDLQGPQRLLAFFDEISLEAALSAYAECRGLNDAIISKAFSKENKKKA